MERQAFLDRVSKLREEREIRKAQAVLQQRQVDDHITQLKQQLASAEQQRAALVAAAERDDHAYAEVIGEIERWIAAEPPPADPPPADPPQPPTKTRPPRGLPR